jgi:glycosyltransferase involved in cell wall biosynthesis
MKIFSIAQVSYVPNVPGMTQNGSGYAHATWDITSNIASLGDSSYLFTYQFKNGFTCRSVECSKLGLLELLKAFTFKKLLLYIKLANKEEKFKWKLRQLKNHLSSNVLAKRIHEIKPDVIILHGVGFDLVTGVLAAIDSGIPFFVVLHGLNALDDSVGLNKCQQRFEIELTKWFNKNGVAISAVSNGVKSDLLNRYGLKSRDKINVILNGVSLLHNDVVATAKLQRKIRNENDEAKIILNVSSLSKRKNQIALIRAFGTLDESERGKYFLILVGEGPARIEIEEEIKKLKLEGNVTLTGRLERSKIINYYAAADLTAVVSISEGFGLPIIESYSAGTPVMIYDDLDAVEDLYFKDAMAPIKRSSDSNLMKDIKKLTSKKWDGDAIKAVAKSFDINAVGSKYNSYCKKTIESFKAVEKASFLKFLEEFIKS